eukprot:TRINITY_DN500_c0_g1_i22.p1 TRINITY_DN500_c0_g1~~TRINITY_DN500_c0_g1_i22.p1  ORF type:complete len:234 (-),score=51.09 TRINITY_DN500_c0_g1_i22:858-1487(-)
MAENPDDNKPSNAASEEENYLMEATAQPSVVSDYLTQDSVIQGSDVLQPREEPIFQDNPEPDPESKAYNEEKASKEEHKDSEDAIVPSEYFLENCKRIIKFGLFRSGLRYLNTLITAFTHTQSQPAKYNKLEQLGIFQVAVYCALKAQDYAQALALCKAVDLANPACKFESYSEFAGLSGTMVSLPFLYFDAIAPYLKDKATVIFLLHN